VITLRLVTDELAMNDETFSSDCSRYTAFEKAPRQGDVDFVTAEILKVGGRRHSTSTKPPRASYFVEPCQSVGRFLYSGVSRPSAKVGGV
jgi:hypothetical protein